MMTQIRFDKIDGFIGVYDGTRYLVLFGNEKYDFIYKKIRYLIGVKSGMAYVITHSYPKTKEHSFESLPIEKIITFHNVIILIKPFFNKYKGNYYYNIFLEKVSYESTKK